MPIHASIHAWKIPWTEEPGGYHPWGQKESDMTGRVSMSASIPLSKWATSSLSTPPADGHLCCFHVLAVVNSAAMNIGIHVSFWMTVLSSYMPRSGIAGSYGNSIFSFLRNFIQFSTVAAPIYIPIIVKEGFLFSISSPAFIICRLFMMAILANVRWCLIVLLIYISLIISNNENLFMYLLTIYMSSLDKCLFRSSTHFLIRLFVFWY